MKALHLSFTCYEALFLAVTIFTTGATETNNVNSVTRSANTWGDAKLQSVVEDSLQKANTIRADLIDVAVTNGIVSLTGSVPTYAQKREASEIAAALRGVRDVKNGLSVTQTARASDSSLAQRVRTAFARDPALETTPIGVTARNGQITLMGKLDSYYRGVLALEIASNIAGVRSVANRLTVDVPKHRDDAQIEGDVESRLTWDTRVDKRDVEPEVADGVVHLSGKVRSAREKKIAIQDSWVAGVKKVDASTLEVAQLGENDRQTYASLSSTNSTGSGNAAAGESGGSAAVERQHDSSHDATHRTDEQIQSAVHDALASNPLLKTGNLNISVENGEARLGGSVPSLYAKNLAADEAASVAGVENVRNALKVRAPHPLSDAALNEQIRQAIHRDASLESAEISSRVRNRRAYLGGRVDSLGEKIRARICVSRVPGVTAIQNDIEVFGGAEIHALEPEPMRLYPAEPPQYADEEVRDRIKAQMYWSPFVRSDTIRVLVNNGTVTLAGTVGSYSEKLAAEKNAYDGGAKHVINNLRVLNRPT